MTDRDPFAEGERAARDNIPAETNPYLDGSDDHALWAAGHGRRCDRSGRIRGALTRRSRGSYAAATIFSVRSPTMVTNMLFVGTADLYPTGRDHAAAARGIVGGVDDRLELLL